MEPVVVQIKPGTSIALGFVFLPFALFGVIYGGLTLIWFGPSIHMVLGLPCTAVFGALSAYFFGIALRKPVALRMDQNGISGFYAEPTSWAEIRAIGVFTTDKEKTFLGITLHDPIAFRDRQTPLRRLKSWSSGRSSGYHILIPEMILQDATARDLALRAKALHAAATAAHDDVT